MAAQAVAEGVDVARVQTSAGSSQARRAVSDAPAQQAELGRRVRVAGDQHADALLLRLPRMHVGQVEAVVVAVDLERDAVEAGRLDQRLDVEPVRLAAQDLAPGRVTDGVDERARHRRQHADRHRLGGLVEGRVHRGDDEIERGQRRLLEVERPSARMSHLDAGQHRDAVDARVRPRGSARRAPVPARRRGRWPSPATASGR